MARFRHGKPITVFRGGDHDEYGDPTPPTSAHVVEGCSWHPRTQGAGPSSQSIDQRGRQGVVEGQTVLADPSVDVTHTDQVALGVRLTLADYDTADLWNVDGEVGEWDNDMSGRRHLAEFAISRAAG